MLLNADTLRISRVPTLSQTRVGMVLGFRFVRYCSSRHSFLTGQALLLLLRLSSYYHTLACLCEGRNGLAERESERERECVCVLKCSEIGECVACTNVLDRSKREGIIIKRLIHTGPGAFAKGLECPSA